MDKRTSVPWLMTWMSWLREKREKENQRFERPRCVGPLASAADMFSTRLFRDVACPLRDSCNRPICLFSHNPAAVLTVTQVDPVHVPVTTPTSIVPAKRRAQADAPLDLQQAPSSSRQSCPVDAERPTKLQKAGSAAKPVAVPTASSSSVSSVQSFTSSLAS
jgi:hypothetical protein